MTGTVLVAGLGAVGANAARQLVDTPGIERVLVADRRDDQVSSVVSALASKRIAIADLDALPRDVDAIVCALPEDRDVPFAEFAIANGISFASATDDADAITQLLALDAAATDAGVTFALGCGLAPGFADLLAKHAAQTFDEVDEVHVARVGVAGPASAASVRRALRAKAIIAKEGVLTEVRPRGHELVWFPEPVQARDCTLVGSGIALLARSYPEARRATCRIAEGSAPSWLFPNRTPDESWGAVRVECWGRRSGMETPLIYGCVERTAVAAGIVLALTGATLAGVLDLRAPDGPYSGAHGLAELVEPVPFLAECAHRGLKAAAFEGHDTAVPTA